jgi:hypothetical protein
MQRSSQRQQDTSAKNTIANSDRAGDVSAPRDTKVTAMKMNGALLIPKPKERKRIFISGVNSLVGHALFEQMRNDHHALL